MKTNEIIQILCRLGITANYSGFFYTFSAVSMTVEDPIKLQLVTKWIYPDIAIKHKTTVDRVEKSIRKVIALAWQRNPTLLSELAMYDLKKQPTNGEFLAILTMWMLNQPGDIKLDHLV